MTSLRKPIYSILTLGILANGCATSNLSLQAQVKPSTPTRKTATPKATPTQKKPPVKKSTPVPSGSFQVPQVEEDDWYGLDGQAGISMPRDPNATRHDIATLAAVSNFGSGLGLEYVQSFSWFSVSGSALYTLAKLNDKASSDAAESGELTEFFDTNTLTLRTQARYSFYRFMYVGLGGALANIQGNYGWRGSAVNGGEIQASFKSRLLLVDLNVGSEFSLPYGLFFGIDWIGTGLPLVKQTKVEDKADVGLTSRAIKNAKPEVRINDEASAQYRLSYLTLRLGYTF